MEGNYPVSIKGEVCGSLCVSKEGAYTRFTVDCIGGGEVIRLSVYGGGKEGYLGVPVPKDGRLRLDKKFSPNAMKDFPDVIERCSLAGEKSCEEKPAEKDEAKCDNTEPEICAETETKTDAERPKDESTYWYATTDGALVSRDGEREMVALRPDDERVPKDFPGEPRVIDGKEYLVYITKEM